MQNLFWMSNVKKLDFPSTDLLICKFLKDPFSLLSNVKDEKELFSIMNNKIKKTTNS